MIDHKQPLIVSLPQTPVFDGDVNENLRLHLSYIKQSAQLGATLVVFAELSLTGYCLPLVDSLAFDENDVRFDCLAEAAREHGITVVVGAPLKNKRHKPAIGAVIFHAHGARQYYRKQYLHAGEGRYCHAGKQNSLFEIAGYRVALAICADMGHAQHASDAIANGADLYLVSALISVSGFAKDAARLASIAAGASIPVLLSNHICASGGWQTAGDNSVWSGDGTRQLSTRHNQAGILLCMLTLDGDITGDFHAQAL